MRRFASHVVSPLLRPNGISPLPVSIRHTSTVGTSKIPPNPREVPPAGPLDFPMAAEEDLDFGSADDEGIPLGEALENAEPKMAPPMMRMSVTSAGFGVSSKGEKAPSVGENPLEDETFGIDKVIEIEGEGDASPALQKDKENDGVDRDLLVEYEEEEEFLIGNQTSRGEEAEQLARSLLGPSLAIAVSPAPKVSLRAGNESSKASTTVLMSSRSNTGISAGSIPRGLGRGKQI